MSDRMTIVDAAEEAGVPVWEMLSWMTRSGMLLVVEPDPDCYLASGEEVHDPGCRCLMVPIHPDVREVTQ